MLLGLGALGGRLFGARGLRDALEAWARGEAGPGAGAGAGAGGDSGPALWVMAVGVCLLGLYFVGWIVLGGLWR